MLFARSQVALGNALGREILFRECPGGVAPSNAFGTGDAKYNLACKYVMKYNFVTSPKRDPKHTLWGVHTTGNP